MNKSKLFKSESRDLSGKIINSILFGIILVVIYTVNIFGQCDQNTGIQVRMTEGEVIVASTGGYGPPTSEVTVASVATGGMTIQPEGQTGITVATTYPGSDQSGANFEVYIPRGTPFVITASPGSVRTGSNQITFANGTFTWSVFNNNLFSGFSISVPKNPGGKEFKLNLKTNEMTINSKSGKKMSVKLTNKISLKFNGKNEDPGLTNDPKTYEIELKKDGTIKFDLSKGTISVTSDGATIKKK